MHAHRYHEFGAAAHAGRETRTLHLSAKHFSCLPGLLTGRVELKMHVVTVLVSQGTRRDEASQPDNHGLLVARPRRSVATCHSQGHV